LNPKPQQVILSIKRLRL